MLNRQEASTVPEAAVGAKASTLARLAGEGFPVPEFFVVPATSLPLDRVAAPLAAAYDRLCERTGRAEVAVRSSAAEEDGPGVSFAGQFTTVLGVTGHEQLLEAVKECWASALPGGSLAVIVQVQVRSRKAGVLFTVHPLEPDGGVACIEAASGAGNSVTAGVGRPETLTISRTTGEILVAAGESVLTAAEARELLAMGLRIEDVLGGAQDIEWAYESGRLWILQARPITAMSGYES